MDKKSSPFRSIILAGCRRGFSSFLWIVKITLPISFAVAVIQWLGWLEKIDFVLNPLMGFLNLPPEAALPIVTGMFTTIYTVIALVTVIPFNPAQATLIAIFSLICHSLIIEGIIQHKSGLNALIGSLVRLAMAVLMVFICSQFFTDTRQSIDTSLSVVANTPFLAFFKDWVLSTIYLVLKMLGIIFFVLILLEFAKQLGWINRVIRFFNPLTHVTGLSSRTNIMWIIANTFGLLYGGAVIVEESKKQAFNPDELKRLHLSIGPNHSMIEDPVLFLLLGLNGFWLWIPRFLSGILAVQAYIAFQKLHTVFLKPKIKGT